jgi:hypothetical protein
MQGGETRFQLVIPVEWASRDGQSRVLRGTSYQDMTGMMPVLPRPGGKMHVVTKSFSFPGRIIALPPFGGMRNDSLGRPHTTNGYVSS